ncbi:MAG: hypothetical protein L0H84_02410 [Pseudonocardia sp.]|nr:hypothetical protein [Pseudonocardia sp.]
MIAMTELVFPQPAVRLRVPMGSAWACTRGQEQLVSSVLLTGGFAIDHNSPSTHNNTGVSAVEHRWRP